MALDPITLGRRLREARENRRLTQEQAAQAIGISRTALVHIESGKRSLSTLELSELAKLYHRSVADFFAEEEQKREPTKTTRSSSSTGSRRNSSTTPRSTARCPAASSSAPSASTSRRRLGIQDPMSLPAYELRAPTRPFEATRQGERVAEEERRRLGLGYGPIADMADLITTQGVWASGVRACRTRCRASSSGTPRLGWSSSSTTTTREAASGSPTPTSTPTPCSTGRRTSAIVSSKENSSGVHRAAGERLRRGLPDAGRGREMVPRAPWRRAARAAATVSPTPRPGTSRSRPRNDQHRARSRLPIRTSCRSPTTSA